MELHAPEGKFLVLYPHDLFVRVRGPGGHLQRIRHRFTFDDQRMITRRLKRVFNPLKNTFSIVGDHRCFTVHQMFGVDDLAAVSITDRLMPEAHAEDRNLSSETPDKFNAYPCVFRTSRAGRNDDSLRFHDLDLIKRQRVIAADLQVRPQLAEILDEVVGDRKSTRLNSSHSSISYAVF